VSICADRVTRFKSLRGTYRNFAHLKENLKVLASDGGYQNFSYRISEITPGHLNLDVIIILKPIIKEIKVKSDGFFKNMDQLNILSLREGDYFDEDKLSDETRQIKEKLELIGFPMASVSSKIKNNSDGISLEFKVVLGQPRIFKSVTIDSNSKFLRKFIRQKFSSLYNKPFDYNRFKLLLDETQRDLMSYGFFLITLDLKPEYKNNRVNLNIHLANDQQFAFRVEGVSGTLEKILHESIRDVYSKFKRVVPISLLKSSVGEMLKKHGYLKPLVDIRTSSVKNKFTDSIEVYRIFIKTGKRSIVKNISFTGNNFISTKDLIKKLSENATDLYSQGFYDFEFVQSFTEKIKDYYYQYGFTLVKVDPVIESFSEDFSDVNLQININEGEQSFIRDINISGLPKDLKYLVLSKIKNRTGEVFNPYFVAEDNKTIISTLQSEGYLNAEVSNLNSDSFITYVQNSFDVFLNYQVNLGIQMKYNKSLIVGNIKTRRKIITNKIQLKQNEVINPDKLRELESLLLGTGLFNSVQVIPLNNTSNQSSTDLLIKVIERDYGLVEFAPGFRTDLGLKFTGTASYNNIDGMNKSLSLRSQVNQRLNYQTFDQRRRKERRSLLEHNTTLSFNQGNVFDSQVDVGMGLSYQRKRFFSFDADIARYNTVLTRALTKRLTSSLRYQYETVTQFDATNEIDNGSFQIGAITPGITLDLRNSAINTTKGAYFNLSCEFANPYFLSQKTSDLEVNYYKLISRNRFYLPFKNGTIALSLVTGVQENLAKGALKDQSGNPVLVDGQPRTQGYIPSIKVFRLTGLDIVRGFNDEEINRLENGQDIGKARVQNMAYLTNIKIEPRYFVNDTFIAGVFYDAGRVSTSSMNFSELRDSVGVTFKILTPVGTLDFDYGIKLLRKRNADGTLESPGRFHVSIGFF